MVSKDQDKKWLAMVGSLDECVLCGAWGTQVAHRNRGKGMGIKVLSAWTAALCPDCHHEIDNGNTLPKEIRLARMDEAILLTIAELYIQGKLKPS